MTDRNQRARRVVLLLTLVRIVAAPVVMGVVLVAPVGSPAVTAAAVGFAAAALTDFLDGRLARRWNVTTTLGTFLDTTADKLLVAGVLIALVAAGRTSAWIAAIIIGRELVILALRGLVASEGVVVRPSVWGKLKANIQFVAIVLAIVRLPAHVGPLYLDEWAMLAAAVVTVVSAVHYLVSFSAAFGDKADASGGAA